MYYFERVENTRGKSLKMCLFPRREKKSICLLKIQLFSLFLYIFISISTKWEIFHQWCYFPEEEENSMIYISSKKWRTLVRETLYCANCLKLSKFPKNWSYFLCLFTYLISFDFISLYIYFYFHEFEKFHNINAFDFQEVKNLSWFMLLPKNKKQRDKHVYVFISMKRQKWSNSRVSLHIRFYFYEM